MSTGGPFDLTGHVAVVTGASRGIGRGIAVALARAGADIVAVSRSMPEHGSQVAEEVANAGRTCETRSVDFSDRDQVRGFGEDLAARDRVPDILVNNAGTIARFPAADHPMQEWDRVLEVNLSAQFLLAQLVGRAMLARGSGKIIFTASLLSYQGGVNVAAYTAAKSGLAGVTRALANEWAAHGVNVNAIVPGYIATDNTKALRDDPQRAADLLARIPAGRWGSADDLGGAAVFLAASASDYVHGCLLPVDGGWLGR